MKSSIKIALFENNECYVESFYVRLIDKSKENWQKKLIWCHFWWKKADFWNREQKFQAKNWSNSSTTFFCVFG